MSQSITVTKILARTGFAMSACYRSIPRLYIDPAHKTCPCGICTAERLADLERNLGLKYGVQPLLGKKEGAA